MGSGAGCAMGAVSGAGRAAGALAVAMGLALGPGAGAQDLRQTPVTKEFEQGEIKATGRPSGYVFRYKAMIIDGKVALCGVGAFEDVYTRSGERSVLRSASFEVNGATAFSDLRYFNTVPRAADLPGAMAYCRVSGIDAPRGDFEYSISWPGRRVRF